MEDITEKIRTSLTFEKVNDRKFTCQRLDTLLEKKFLTMVKKTFGCKDMHQIYLESIATELLRSIIVSEFHYEYKVDDMRSLTITTVILDRVKVIKLNNIDGILAN